MAKAPVSENESTIQGFGLSKADISNDSVWVLLSILSLPKDEKPDHEGDKRSWGTEIVVVLVNT